MGMKLAIVMIVGVVSVVLFISIVLAIADGAKEMAMTATSHLACIIVGFGAGYGLASVFTTVTTGNRIGNDSTKPR